MNNEPPIFNTVAGKPRPKNVYVRGKRYEYFGRSFTKNDSMSQADLCKRQGYKVTFRIGRSEVGKTWYIYRRKE